MKIVVLGGKPTRPVRHGSMRQAETHSAVRSPGTLALSADGQQWALLNPSPNVAHQLDTDPFVRSHAGLGDGPVRAVVLTDAQVDHGTGLLGLRDGAPIALYATPAVFEELTTALPVLPMLQHYCPVQWRVIPVAGETHSARFDVHGLHFVAMAAGPQSQPEDGTANVGEHVSFAVQDPHSGRRLFCTTEPHMGEAEIEWMQQADCVFFGAQSDTAQANAPSAEQWAWLASLPAARKVLLPTAKHATHPQAERAWRECAQAHGIECAYDGMEIEL